MCAFINLGFSISLKEDRRTKRLSLHSSVLPLHVQVFAASGLPFFLIIITLVVFVCFSRKVKQQKRHYFLVLFYQKAEYYGSILIFAF